MDTNNPSLDFALQTLSKKYEVARLLRPLINPIINVIRRKFTIVIHHRLGDLAGSKDIRFMGLNIIEKIASSLSKDIFPRLSSLYDSCTIHILTQSSHVKAFSSAAIYNPLLRMLANSSCKGVINMDEKSEISFDAMVTAELLVGGSSGFPRAAMFLRSKPFMSPDVHIFGKLNNPNFVKLNRSGEFIYDELFKVLRSSVQ